MHQLKIRPGSVADLPPTLGLLDGAIGWLAAQGRTRQWGDTPFSASEARTAQIATMMSEHVVRVAENSGHVVGVSVLADRPTEYVEPAVVPELYVHLLVSDRAWRGHGIGLLLIDDAREVARNRGAEQLRVDCFAGDDQALVGAYRRLGFTPEQTFVVDTGQPEPWPGCVLRQDV